MPLPKAIRVYELPDALKKYIQEKGASGISGLHLMPLVFPVFIMNPAEYPPDSKLDPPYKARLGDIQSATAATAVNSASVPKGEIWEVTNVFGLTDALAGTMAIRNDTEVLKYNTNIKFIDWQGKQFLAEGEYMRVTHSNSGNIVVHIVGVKRYA